MLNESVNYDDAMRYGVSTFYSKYSLYDKTITNRHLTQDIIKTHIAIAYIVTKREEIK